LLSVTDKSQRPCGDGLRFALSERKRCSKLTTGGNCQTLRGDFIPAGNPAPVTAWRQCTSATAASRATRPMVSVPKSDVIRTSGDPSRTTDLRRCKHLACPATLKAVYSSIGVFQQLSSTYTPKSRDPCGPRIAAKTVHDDAPTRCLRGAPTSGATTPGPNWPPRRAGVARGWLAPSGWPKELIPPKPNLSRR
jgi:hypothetical protein